ncbi:hypothetical protein pb186bvf_006769 [Paramecium bursaria]
MIFELFQQPFRRQYIKRITMLLENNFVSLACKSDSLAIFKSININAYINIVLQKGNQLRIYLKQIDFDRGYDNKSFNYKIFKLSQKWNKFKRTLIGDLTREYITSLQILSPQRLVKDCQDQICQKLICCFVGFIIYDIVHIRLLKSTRIANNNQKRLLTLNDKTNQECSSNDKFNIYLLDGNPSYEIQAKI